MEKEKAVYRGGCPHCLGSEDVLDMDTVLYFGFGGYYVTKDDEKYYCGDPNGEWDSFKTLSDIESAAARHPDAKWEMILSNPLRGATWERQKDGHRILTETNMGFA